LFVDDDDVSDIFNKRERVKTLPLFAYFFFTKTHAQTAKRGKDERERERRDESREDDASAREKDGSERFV